MAAADTALRSLSLEVGKIGQETGQFRKIANQQNGTIANFVKDVGRLFSTNTAQQGQLNNNMNELQQTTAQTGQKVDQTNYLMQSSISIQTQMLNEMKNAASTLKDLYNIAFNNNINGADPQNNRGLLGRALGFGAAGAVGLAAGDLLGGGNIVSGILGAQSTMESGLGKLNSYFGNETNTTQLSQPVYADVSAGSESTKKILEAIKKVESGGDYSTPNKAGVSSASGAYQFIDSTWQSLAKKYGIGTEYARAMQAPPQVQDAVAAKYVEEILRQNNGDVSKVPVVWLTGNAQGKMSADAAAINPSVAQYQQKWLNAYTGAADNPNRRDNDVDESQYSTNMAPQDWMKFLQERSSGANISGLNPDFGKKLAAALAEAEQVTGQRAKIVSGYRSVEEQAILYDRYKRGVGGLAAPPGRSRHQHGNAVDLADGPVREALRNGIDSKYGIEDLYSKIGKDMPHFQLAGAPAGGGGGEYSGGMNLGNMASAGYAAATGRGGGLGIDTSPLMMMGLPGMMPSMDLTSSLFPLMNLIGGVGMDLASAIGGTLGGGFGAGGEPPEHPIGMGKDHDHDAPDNSVIQGADEPRAVAPIQAAALHAEVARFAPPPVQIQQPVYAEAAQPRTINTSEPYTPSHSGTSSPSWYLQLAGRIHNDEAMKFKGGVFA